MPHPSPSLPMTWLHKLLAFARKDLRVALSYRTDFLLRNFFIFGFTLLFYFAGQSMGPDGMGLPSGESIEYFPYVIVGLAFLSFLNTLVNDFPENVRSAQTYGTLEPMLVTSTPIPLILTGTLAYPLIRSTYGVIAYLLLASILGVDFTQANLFSAGVMLAATVLAFSGLGAFMAATVMVVKQNFSNVVLQTLFALFGGVFFPVDALPPSVRWVAHLVPLSPALEGMRSALLEGASVRDLWQPIGALALFALVLLPTGFSCFRAAIRIAQRDGTLTYR